LLAFIAFGIVLIFVNIPGGALIYSVLGLVIFAGFTMLDFQRIRRSRYISSAPLPEGRGQDVPFAGLRRFTHMPK